MHGVYNLFSYLERDEIKTFWEHACKRLGYVLTRWWLVGMAAINLDRDWEIWRTINCG